MGYSITIGNAVPVHKKDYFPDLTAYWDVEKLTLEDAPSFPNETERSNNRCPSYSTWGEFCDKTGLRDLFYNEEYGFFRKTNGCVGITRADADFVTKALTRYRSTSTMPPGFEASYGHRGAINYDYHLARLIWLEFWMRWAVENCETPAISYG